MAEKFSIDLTIVQAEVIVRALELCGANDDLGKVTRYFNDIDLARNAKPTRKVVHGALMRASHRHTVATDAQRAVGETDRFKAQNESLKFDVVRITNELASVQRVLRQVAELVLDGENDQAVSVLQDSALVAELFEEHSVG